MSSTYFGKLPVKKDDRTLQLANYLKSALGPPPTSYNALDNVYRAIGKPDFGGRLFPMVGNADFENCTFAAAAHALTVYYGLIGKTVVLSEKEVVESYYNLTGGTNQSLLELDVLKYWRKEGLAGERIFAFMSIDLRNRRQVQQAIYLLGGVYVGFKVQEKCRARYNHGETWVPAPLTEEGHAVFAVGYDPGGITVLTWERLQPATWAWWDLCVDEAYAILPFQALDSRFPSGFDLDGLKRDLAAVAD